MEQSEDLHEFIECEKLVPLVIDNSESMQSVAH